MSQEEFNDAVNSATKAEREMCAYLRKEIPLCGEHTAEYENGFWDALAMYENAILARGENK